MPVTQIATSVSEQFAEAVRAGLSARDQKTLPSQYFYDAVGSALFEAITTLPEYGLTRADAGLLEAHSAEIVSSFDNSLRIVELGSGSAIKTRWVLDAAVERWGRVSYFPIDVSEAALEVCSTTFAGDAAIETYPQHATYLDGLRAALADRSPRERILVLFLGSTIGNFDAETAPRFLGQVRAQLAAGDGLLLGADLVQPLDRMLRAYDDPIGVTAAFNLNLLARINRELCGRFDIRSFAHEARFDTRHSRMEMHLCSTRAQKVSIEALGNAFSFTEGETIWTESSYKFTLEGLRALARSGGFRCRQQWVSTGWAFSENLLLAA